GLSADRRPESDTGVTGFQQHTQMKEFSFHPELLEYRERAMQALQFAGFEWFSDYAAVDLLHDEFGLEVCGIRGDERATEILQVMRATFPDWKNHKRWFYDSGSNYGWTVAVSKYPFDIRGLN